MSDPWAMYDAYLEAPYQRAAEEWDAYVDFCEARELDPDDESSWEAFGDCDPY